MDTAVLVALIGLLGSGNLVALIGWLATWLRKRRLEAATRELLPHVEGLARDLRETDAAVLAELRRSARRARSERRINRQPPVWPLRQLSAPRARPRRKP